MSSIHRGSIFSAINRVLSSPQSYEVGDECNFEFPVQGIAENGDMFYHVLLLTPELIVHSDAISGDVFSVHPYEDSTGITETGHPLRLTLNYANDSSYTFQLKAQDLNNLVCTLFGRLEFNKYIKRNSMLRTIKPVPPSQLEIGNRGSEMVNETTSSSSDESDITESNSCRSEHKSQQTSVHAHAPRERSSEYCTSHKENINSLERKGEPISPSITTIISPPEPTNIIRTTNSVKISSIGHLAHNYSNEKDSGTYYSSRGYSPVPISPSSQLSSSSSSSISSSERETDINKKSAIERSKRKLNNRKIYDAKNKEKNNNNSINSDPKIMETSETYSHLVNSTDTKAIGNSSLLSSDTISAEREDTCICSNNLEKNECFERSSRKSEYLKNPLKEHIPIRRSVARTDRNSSSTSHLSTTVQKFNSPETQSEESSSTSSSAYGNSFVITHDLKVEDVENISHEDSHEKRLIGKKDNNQTTNGKNDGEKSEQLMDGNNKRKSERIKMDKELNNFGSGQTSNVSEQLDVLPSPISDRIKDPSSRVEGEKDFSIVRDSSTHNIDADNISSDSVNNGGDAEKHDSKQQLSENLVEYEKGSNEKNVEEDIKDGDYVSLNNFPKKQDYIEGTTPKPLPRRQRRIGKPVIEPIMGSPEIYGQVPQNDKVFNQTETQSHNRVPSKTLKSPISIRKNKVPKPVSNVRNQIHLNNTFGELTPLSTTDLSLLEPEYVYSASNGTTSVSEFQPHSLLPPFDPSAEQMESTAKFSSVPLEIENSANTPFTPDSVIRRSNSKCSSNGSEAPLILGPDHRVIPTEELISILSRIWELIKFVEKPNRLHLRYFSLHPTHKLHCNSPVIAWSMVSSNPLKVTDGRCLMVTSISLGTEDEKAKELVQTKLGSVLEHCVTLRGFQCDKDGKPVYGEIGIVVGSRDVRGLERWREAVEGLVEQARVSRR